jgi:dihydropyrimidinase
MAAVLIKNGCVVTATTSLDADVLIEKGKIKKIASGLEPTGTPTRVIDAAGFYILPGGIDPHVHMELPAGGGQFSADDFETGTRAAIAGGVTTIIDFVTPERGQPLDEAAVLRKKLAEKSLCDYALHMSVTRWSSRTAEEMKQCLRRHGMSSVKIYMAYKDAIGLNDDEILNLMDAAAELGVLVMVHCEHGEAVDFLQKKLIARGKRQPRYHPLSRPPIVEEEAVKRAMVMASLTGCSLYIVHVSTRGALREIRAALDPGLPVLAETCPQYLLLDEREYQRPGFEGAAYVMSPPLRTGRDRQALWKAIQDGVIKTVATDHCPFNMKGQKDRGADDFRKIPNGAAGVEHRMMLLYRYGVLENKISINRFVEVLSEQPAKIFGLYPRKGIIAEGSDADIVLWDPGKKGIISARDQLQNCDTSIYEGFEIKGGPHLVMLRGVIVFENGKVTAQKGAGVYLCRTPRKTSV